ncbi:MAG: radical SAM protein [Candidatus Omnitrophica bacterium]|nr:radical SAM protein [Candidatus Omnitrophota bacterium]
MHKKFKYIYGPVFSWRLKSSLGIDLVSLQKKMCNFNCIYCQLGPTKRYTTERKIYVPLKELIKELERLPEIKIDYITFSGSGEPTLARNLGEVIKTIKKIRKEKIAVLTNSSLMDKEEVRKDLSLADFVIAKLDAYSPDSLQKINSPHGKIEFAGILDGMIKFKKEYKTRLALRIMFIDKNKDNVNKFIYLTNSIKPDEVQINTPLRTCNIKPLSREEVFKIKEIFVSACKEVEIVSVYDKRLFKEVVPLNEEDTLKRRTMQ